MYAVVRTGGYQYIMKPGDRVVVPRMKAEPGAEVKFDDVLFLNLDSRVVVGTPRVEGASVMARVLSEIRSPKKTAYKFIRRENYRRKMGHRQSMTEVRVDKIEFAE
jgi:large subunit ribosomal protein L21